MSNTNTQSILNLGRFELRQVKNAYNSNNTNYKKLAKLYEKVRALGAEIDVIKSMIDSWEAPIKHLSQSKFGVELTSQEILLSYSDPEKFLAEHPEFNSNAADNTEAEAAPTQTEESEEQETEEEHAQENSSDFPF